MQIHILSFEGPDAYSMAGGLGTRVQGLTAALTGLGHETHLWFVGDPDLPGHEVRDGVHLHRWCHFLSRHFGIGVYHGQEAKVADYSRSLPAFLMDQVLGPYLRGGGRAAVLAEEWQTTGALLSLDRRLRNEGTRAQVTMTWNANNTFGFELVDWEAMAAAASITTVSRYMRHRMRSEYGIDAAVIPNGLSPDVYLSPDNEAVARLQAAHSGRTVLAKMARFDPDKRWLGAVGIAAAMRQRGLRPLLIARGGREAYGGEVLQEARERGLRIVERSARDRGPAALVEALREPGDADVIHLTSHVDPDARRVLFKAADVVLANSSHEPFGLVGLEAMAVGGLACLGCTGEDYGVPGGNAMVLQTSEPEEFLGAFDSLKRDPRHLQRLRRAGRNTARQYAWPRVIRHNLFPWLSLASARQSYQPGIA